MGLILLSYEQILGLGLCQWNLLHNAASKFVKNQKTNQILVRKSHQVRYKEMNFKLFVVIITSLLALLSGCED